MNLFDPKDWDKIVTVNFVWIKTGTSCYCVVFDLNKDRDKI